MNNFEDITLKKYKQILRVKNYSNRTIENYSSVMKVFNSEMPRDLYHCNKNDIQDYFFNKRFTSISQQNIFISAVKLFYRYIVGKKLEYFKFERPRKETHLPKVIDKKLLLLKIESVVNLKHRAILSIGFSVGLRVSEVCNLKIYDIDSTRMLIMIRNGKGNKDRIVPLTEKILFLLRDYYKQYRPSDYLFEGQFGGKYSTESCEKLIKKYIDSESGFHLLRHSSFTSMLENGTDLRIIQSIAGHKSSKTTEIYTHVSTNCIKQAAMPI